MVSLVHRELEVGFSLNNSVDCMRNISIKDMLIVRVDDLTVN